MSSEALAELALGGRQEPGSPLHCRGRNPGAALVGTEVPGVLLDELRRKARVRDPCGIGK